VEFFSTAKTVTAHLSGLNCLIRRCDLQSGLGSLSLLVAGDSVSGIAVCLSARSYCQTGLWHWLGLWDRLMVCGRLLAVYLNPCLRRYQCFPQCDNDFDHGAGDGAVYCGANLPLSALFSGNAFDLCPALGTV